MKPAFGRVKGGVANVAKIDVAKKRIGLAYALQGRNRTDPEGNGQTDPPPGRQAESETGGDHDGHQNQFPVPTQKQVRPVRRLMNGRFSGLVNGVHGLNHRTRNAERARQHGCCKNEDRDDETDHAGPPPELG